MKRKAKDHDGGTPHLFDLEEFICSKPQQSEHLTGNLWTHQKADLIARYLYSFLAVTKNGIYIDAFAGPQHPESRDESWAAKKVLEKRSQYLGRACLFEQDPDKMPLLEQLRKEHCQGYTRLWRRQVVVTEGDCNIEIPKYLRQHPIKPKRATFALLDQRTHECSWDLVRTLANHKVEGTKVELFYFLAQGWMNRSVKSAKTPEKFDEIEAWWGRSDWRDFMELKSFERAGVLEKRFKEDLGYRHSKAFPMKQRGNDGTIMFWLIHASDHPRAIPLMAGAYRSIGLRWSDTQWEQTKMEDLCPSLGVSGILA
jgi:three-Cys-motif partner protein